MRNWDAVVPLVWSVNDSSLMELPRFDGGASLAYVLFRSEIVFFYFLVTEPFALVIRILIMPKKPLGPFTIYCPSVFSSSRVLLS